METKYTLKKLDAAITSAEFCGFTLKEGFFYGTETSTGTPVATSGWCRDGYVSLYILDKGKWTLCWVDPEEIGCDLKEKYAYLAKGEGKLSFADWMYKYLGMTLEEYDEVPDEGDQVPEMYEDYLWDNLPLFLRS